MRAETGDVRLMRARWREKMTALVMIAKGLVMTAIAAAAFMALAMAIGYEPAAAKTGAQCETKPAPACLFMIL